MKAHQLIVLAGMGAIGAGCGDPAGPTTPPERDVRPWVTGAAAEAVDENGHFRFEGQPPDWPCPCIDEAAARIQAQAFVRTFCPDLQSSLDLHHGDRVDCDALEPASRAVPVQSPYETVPDSFPLGIRKVYGPQYLSRLYQHGVPAVSVFGSALNTDLWVENGSIRGPSSASFTFQVTGIPRGGGYLNPIGPEAAVVVAAQATGALVAEVPELILPRREYGFVFAKWRVILDRPARLRDRTTGQIIETDTLYVGLHIRPVTWDLVPDAILVPQAQQPDSDTIYRFDDSGQERMWILPFRPDRPVAFLELIAL